MEGIPCKKSQRPDKVRDKGVKEIAICLDLASISSPFNPASGAHPQSLASPACSLFTYTNLISNLFSLFTVCRFPKE